MATHTAGPWRAHFCERNKRFHTGRWTWFAPDPNFPGHETIVDTEKQNGVGEANARLIAAAPELLAACEVLMGDVESYRSRGGTLTAKEEEHVAIMKAAIAKAIGK